jgi:hypothetical protein
MYLYYLCVPYFTLLGTTYIGEIWVAYTCVRYFINSRPWPRLSWVRLSSSKVANAVEFKMRTASNEKLISKIILANESIRGVQMGQQF